MTSGYSGTPLVKKLGIKDGYSCLFVNTPSNYFDLLNNLPDIHPYQVKNTSPESMDFIHLFVQFQKDLQSQWKVVKPRLKKNGMLWISWPKGKSKIDRDLDENVIRHVGLTGGLVDVKICAVDEDWSGLKFMYRKMDR